jgi:hypothetical protein
MSTLGETVLAMAESNCACYAPHQNQRLYHPIGPYRTIAKVSASKVFPTGFYRV